MKTVLFYWSKGSEVRVRIVQLIEQYNKGKRPVFSNELAKQLGLSHVAVSKHLDLLVTNGFVKVTNPGGKPQYLELTPNGLKVADEFSSKEKQGLSALGF